MSLKLLYTNWHNLIQDLQLNSDIGDAFFCYLVECYQSSPRHYHNLSHLEYLLAMLAEVEGDINSHSAMYLAVWFHDCIYNPCSQTNELESAQLALNFLEQVDAEAELIELVGKTILSTKSHQPLIDNLDCQFFLDADLAILGASNQQYQQYTYNIRQEYEHFSDRSYVLGRSKVLENFLAREKNYYTDYFSRKLGNQAQINIREELKELKTHYLKPIG